MNVLALVILPVLLMTSKIQAAWFTETPLNRSYQALLNDQPQLAWQELQIALSKEAIDSQYWLPVKQQILSVSQCGQQLFSHSLPASSNFSISFIRRSGWSSQGYQIKLSAQKLQSELAVELISPLGRSLLSGQFSTKDHYQEIETEEMIIKPVSGVYRLKLNKNVYPLIIAIADNKDWLVWDNNTQDLFISLPSAPSTCHKPIATWQWFDSNYSILGDRIPIQQQDPSLSLLNTQPDKAKHLSAAVSYFEYQQGIKVEYVQRVSVPFFQKD